MIGSFFLQVSPAMLRALAPGYHPQRIEDPDWAGVWGEHYKDLEDGMVPLLDTENPDIPPVFAAA